MSQTAIEISQRMKSLGEKASDYMKSRGFSVTQHNGQRISVLNDAKEPNETDQLEVFVGKVPREMFEDELLPVFERAGRVYKIRLMMDFSCTNRGFAFVKYMSSYEAEWACSLLNSYVMKPNTAPIGVLPSFDNKRLYFGNLPIKCTKERLAKELANHTAGVKDIELPEVPCKSDRRYAFVTFVSHDAATQARRIFVPGDVKMFGRILTIDWAKTDKTHLNRSASSISSAHLSPTDDLASIRNTRLTPKPLGTIDYNNNCSNRNINSSSSFSNSGNHFNKHLSNYNNSSNDLMSHATAPPPSPQLQLQPPTSILGVKTWQMLESCLPNATVSESTNIITICNINFNLVSIGNLKRIFELAGRLRILEIQALSLSSITVAYQSHDQADVMLEALILYPNCFERLALPNQILTAYRGSIYSI